MNVGENTALGNGDMAKELVQFFIVPNGELKMTGDDTGLLVVACSVTGKLEDFSGEIFENSGEINGSTLRQLGNAELKTRGKHTGTNTLSVVTLAKKTVDTTDRELETRLGGARLRLRRRIGGGLARLGLAAALARHIETSIGCGSGGG